MGERAGYTEEGSWARAPSSPPGDPPGLLRPPSPPVPEPRTLRASVRAPGLPPGEAPAVAGPPPPGAPGPGCSPSVRSPGHRVPLSAATPPISPPGLPVPPLPLPIPHTPPSSPSTPLHTHPPPRCHLGAGRRVATSLHPSGRYRRARPRAPILPGPPSPALPGHPRPAPASSPVVGRARGAAARPAPPLRPPPPGPRTRCSSLSSPGDSEMGPGYPRGDRRRRDGGGGLCGSPRGWRSR